MVMFSPRITIQLVLVLQGVCFAAIRHQKSAKTFGLLIIEPRIFDKPPDRFLEFSNRPSEALESVTEFQRLFLNKLLTDSTLRAFEKTSFLFTKNVRQRDKRYTSRLTMCHFKICPMGRKRTTRHFHFT